MADCSEHKNPLQHNGTSQAHRFLQGLDKTKYALVDEKDFADWIVFANEYARFVKYYGNSNSPSGNWQLFFNSDISAQLGIVAIQDIERYRSEVKQRFDFIKDDDNKSSINPIEIKLNEVFSGILTLSKALDEAALTLPDETTLKATIQNLAKAKLAGALKRFIAYYAGAQNRGYLNKSFLSDWKILNEPLTDAQQIIDAQGLSNIWLSETVETNWIDYKNSITPDESIFNNPLTNFSDEYLSIAHAANHNLFSGIFDTYLTAYTSIINEASAELSRSLEKYDAHAPHYALFLAFLRLFKFAQKNINTLTQRHLDFYYKEVLRLKPKDAEANHAHILVELAKQIDEHVLAAKTELKAGKDSLNKDVIYALDNDTVFNKAKVSQLKTFYKANNDDTIFEAGTANVTEDNDGRIFASPVANSDDGNGADLTSANKEWHPYVHKVFKEAQLESIAMPKARIGFAMASHYLYLTEGERKVYIRLALNPLNALDGKHIECYLTTAKGWYNVGTPTISSSGKKMSDNTNCAEISFMIPGKEDAIVNYSAKVHGRIYDVALPVLEIYLSNNDDNVYEYDLLKGATITKLELEVRVGMDSGYNKKGLKNLLLSNDFGPIDASKPFQPFGPQPTAGNRLVIGSKEIFTKKGATINLNFEWKDLLTTNADISYVTLSDSGNFPNVAINGLDSGIWQTVKSYDELFTGSGPTTQISLSGSGVDNIIADYADDYIGYGTNSTNGFIAVQLTQSFGHKEYLRDYARYLLERSPDIPDTITSEPKEPYTPVLQSFYVSYSAHAITDVLNADETAFNNREIRFFHIYPFGEGEQNKYLQPSSDVYLVPQFKHVSEGTTMQHIGEFYIGIENLAALQSVNILFQVMEGTTDPLKQKPESHIHWSYLSNNEWIDFKNDEYSDNTLQLVQSGIISFAIPKAATTDNTILPSGYIWIRAAIAEAAEAVCKLIAVNAQAALTTFANNNNADDFLNTALPAGTISKPKNPDAAVKKITQPYPSFGGRPKETEGQYYIRVSERLRHKKRAITVWDYEHLVLEAFPEIYKVKCLNHTQIEPGVYNEVKPGYVSIITIPSLQNRNDVNPLKPYTQQSTLTRIENFLKPLTSCFVKLHATQPQFEEVNMEFSLKLYDQYTDFTFYSNRLKDEITQFLSPWAFGRSTDLEFGGKVYKSVIINFIEERYYVDFITDVVMRVKVDEQSDPGGDQDEITASTARSILVSAPASAHKISQLTDSDDDNAETCLDPAKQNAS